MLGTWTNNEVRTYDSLGRVYLDYKPYTASGNGYWVNSYDLRNRLISAQLHQANGTTDRTYIWTHLGRTLQLEDPLLHVMTYVNDVVGHLRRVTDPSPGGLTQYAYDAFGNLNATTDAGGALSSATYNLRGFKTQTIDPDQGTWNFKGDSLNELVAYTDANGKSFGIVYDALGRMISRNEPDLYSAWTWGTSAAAHEIGSLHSVCTGTGTNPTNCTAAPGYSEAVTYDGLGRPSDRAITIPADATYSYDFAYNSIGAIDTITYPTSPAPTGTTATRYKIQYGYNSGSPTQITDITQPTPVTLWRLNAVNDYASPTSETLGVTNATAGTAAVAVAETYKAWTDEITSIQGGISGSATNRQNLAYQWDLNGNLNQRQDLSQGLTEAFTPDALNRLNFSTLTGVTGHTLDVTYDASGNIASRSDVGTSSHTYDYTSAQSGCTYTGLPAQPHALRNAGGGAFVYCYDNNGNAIARNGLSQTWASYNLPVTLQANLGGTVYSSAFLYGPEHQRYQQTAAYLNGTELTQYVGGLLEKVSGTATATTHYRHYVPTPSGLTIVVYRNGDHTTSTQYAMADHLGSTDAVLDGAGNFKVRESFGAFGLRRQSNWQAGNPSSGDWAAISAATRRGFTFQEQLDNIGLVHMNGRVYDPNVGRFLSVDPIVSDLADSQSVNPYAYVGNRPLSAVDPSGYDPVLDTVVVQTGGPTNPVGAAVTILDLASDFFFGGLFAAAPPPPPPATTIQNPTAQSGIGANPCSGAPEACTGVAGVTVVGSMPSVVAQGLLPSDLVAGQIVLDGQLYDFQSEVIVNGQRPGQGLFSKLAFNLLIKPAFGLFDCLGKACSPLEAALAGAGPALTAMGGPEGAAAKGAEAAGKGLAERILTSEGKALTEAKPVGNALQTDPFHRAASFVRDEAATSGTHFSIVGGDGVTRTLTQIPGELNGISGRFEYIVDDVGQLSHQRFVPGGTINGIPNVP